MNYEEYIELETAKLAKKAGFDWECGKIYWKYEEGIWELEDNHKEHCRILQIDYCILAPTQAVLQRWLREIKNTQMQILFESMTVNKYYAIIKMKDIYHDFLMKDNHVAYFDTYEAALEAGLQKCLTLIIEKQ